MPKAQGKKLKKVTIRRKAEPQASDATKPTKPTILGYRTLNSIEVAVINSLKAKGEEMRAILDAAQHTPGVDHRWLSIARTHFQQGYMALVRSVARPESFA